MSMLFPEGASLLIVVGFYAAHIVLRLVFLFRVDSLVSFFFRIILFDLYTYIHSMPSDGQAAPRSSSAAEASVGISTMREGFYLRACTMLTIPCFLGSGALTAGNCRSFLSQRDQCLASTTCADLYSRP